MKRNRSVALLLALAAASTVLAVAPLRAQAPADTALARKVDAIATQVLKSTGVPSATVAVVTHGKLAYANAYGNAKLEPATPARPDMRYAIGSISKQFTAAAVLLLQQEGKLSLDDPVSKYIPGLTRGNDVTIRQLLSHTSGYQDFWPQDYVMPMMLKPTTPQGILDVWAKKPLDFEPGTRWQYSNTNFAAAGLVVEKVSGTPFWQFLQTRILKPLGMTSASDYDANGFKAVDATGYLRYALGPLRPAPEAAPGWGWAMGELAMTASDLAKWDISMIDRSLLAPTTYQIMETDVLLKNGAATGYGLGVDVGMQNGHLAISHGGEMSGFTAENMVFPADSAAVVVLTNQDAAPASGSIAQQIARMLFTTEDTLAASRTARARAILEGLQQGKIDRSLFTPNANAYFSAQALQDFASSLGPLGAPSSFVQAGQGLRGGMILRSYRVSFPNGQTIRAWTYELPDGKIEQYQVSPLG